jgi:hypothetical protein
MPARSLDREIDRLYELAPEDFTTARDRLAKDLKASGDTEGTARVKALRRPTLAAWAVNQLVRRESGGVDALLEAGDQLRRMQRRALSGVSGGGLREATDQRRKAVRTLLNAAEDILKEAGRASAGTLEAVQATLEAASTDEGAGRMFEEGRLAKEFPPPAGFGTVDGLALVPPPAEPRTSSTRAAVAPAKAGRGHGRGSQRDRDAARIAELRAERDQAQRQARDLEREATKARREAQRAGQAAVKAEEEAERAQRASDEAAQTARKLAATARQAGTEAARAQRESDRAKRSVEQVKEKLTEAQG